MLSKEIFRGVYNAESVNMKINNKFNIFDQEESSMLDGIRKISKNILFLSALVLMGNLQGAGETGKLAGRVSDISNGNPLVGTNIIITAEWINGKEVPLQNMLGAATDIYGDYFIINVRPGLYTVKVTYVGYQEEHRTGVKVTIDKSTSLNFELLPRALSGEEVIVTAFQEAKVEMDVTATKSTYSFSDVENIAGVSDISGILELQADVVDDHFRGGRLGESTYILGGTTIINPLNNNRAFRPIVSGIEQVEVYTSGFSAEYGNAQSGVVNMVAKEGRKVWDTKFEMSSNQPYYKTWGGSLYNTDNLYFFKTLSDLEEWLKENPTQPGRKLYDPGYGFGPAYLVQEITFPPTPLLHEDTLKIAKLGQIQWMQSVQDAGLEYKDLRDYRVDFSTGGPISKNSTIFMASRYNITHPKIPTPNPDRNIQILSNYVYRPNSSNKLKMSYMLNLMQENVIGSAWTRWMFDRTLSVSQIRSRSEQLGFDWMHVFNPSTFMNIQLTQLNLTEKQNMELIQEDELVVDYTTSSNWVDYTGPSTHRVGRPEDDRGEEASRTTNFSGSITSQINKANLLKTGFQYYSYFVSVDREQNAYSLGNIRHLFYEYSPYEGAVYMQDKIEFDGIIANLGLRFDFFNLNTDFYSDIYSPTRNPEYDPSLPYSERGQYYDTSLALKEDAKPYYRLQPRIGISFPVTETSVFHLNYGTFSQRPNFTQLIGQRYYENLILYGNPRLKPEYTTSYDVGLVKGLPWKLRIDISGYYKDVKNLVERAYFWDEQQSVNATYVNRDYADVKGFHVSMERYSGSLRGYLRYNYEVATGKSSNDLDVPVIYFEVPDPVFGSIKLPDPEDVFLDYDRTHKAVINVRYKTKDKSGFSIGNLYPFGGVSLSTTMRISTGRPYTWDESGQGLKYNQRTPLEREMKLRLEKRIKFNSVDLTFYCEGFNLLNEPIYNYSRTFNSDKNTHRWEQQKQYDKDGVETFTDEYPYEFLTYEEYSPYITDQRVYLLSNQPRRFRLGLKLAL